MVECAGVELLNLYVLEQHRKECSLVMSSKMKELDNAGQLGANTVKTRIYHRSLCEAVFLK